MKKLLLMFVMAFVGLVAYAQDPIVSITTEVANQQSSVQDYLTTWTLGAPESSETWSVANFNNNLNKEAWNCMRCGRKNNPSVATITTDFAINAAVNKVVVNMIPFIKATDKDKLTSLELQISSSNDFTAPETTIPAEDYMTATQNTAEDVTFTIPAPAANKYYRLVFTCASTAANNGFVQVNSISYYGEASASDAPAMPVIKMAAGNMVEISAAEGAQIYYTLTGEDPTVDNGTLYDGAFRINDAVEVKAIAVVEGKSSSVANFSAYLNTVTSIDELIELNDLTHTLTLEAPLTIVYHNGRYMYVNQDNAWLLLYGVNSDNTYTNGAQLASVTGSFTLYRSLIPEMTNVQLGDVTEGGTPVEATAMTIADINSFGATPALMNYFVKFEGVTIDLDNTKLVQDGSELTYYNQFALTLPEATEGKTYNVEGFISYYGEAVQLNIINVTEVEEPETPGFEYTIPDGKQETGVGHETYVESITTTGAASDLNASYTGEPSSVYTLVENTADVYPGSEFTLNLVGHSLGDYTESAVRQDLRFTCAYLWVDWYGNGQWEKISDHGNLPPTHYRGGNMDVLNITETLTMPADVPVGTKARIRVIYANAWTVPGATSNSSSQGKDAADPNSKLIEGGLAYDIVLNAVEVPVTTYAITIAEAENGSIKVMNGEEEITSGTEVEEGTTLTIEATPAENYSLEAITLNDAALAANEDGSYSFIVDEAYTVAATFAINKYAVTITEPENGTLVVMNGEETVATGTELAHGTELTIIATPAEGYELGAITVNDTAIESNTLTLTEAATIAATFNEAKTPAFEYTIPDGKQEAGAGHETYVETITTTGAASDLNASYTGEPSSIYTLVEGAADVYPGSEFTLNLVGHSKGDYSTTTVHQDLRFTCAYLWVDWYGNGQWEKISDYGSLPPSHNVGGNMDVLNITETLTMPADVPAGTQARIRVIYANAWTVPGATSNSSSQGKDAADPNSKLIEGGLAYDIVLNAVEAPAPTYAVTIAETEATVSANVEDLTAVEEGTEVIFTITAPEGKQIVSVTYNDETLTANEDGTYTVTVNADGTLAVTLEDIPEPGKSILVPETSGNTLYGFRFDDAVLGSHNNGSCDANDLRSHSFTYSAWVKPMNTSGRIMGNIQTDWTTTDGAFWVYLKDGKLTLGGRGNDADNEWKAQENISISASTDPGTEVGEWVFISVVADQAAKTVTLYKNCKPVCSYEVNNKIGLLPDKASFYVGDGGCSVALTEVQLWNKALTSDELMDTYDFHYTETPENLAAYYKVTELVEGSTTDLRNLGTVATDVPAQLLQATKTTISGWIPGFGNPQPQVIEPIDEDRVLGTAAITLVQPESEGNSFAVVNADGKVLGSEVTLFEKLNVASTLAEGIEVLGVIVETEGQTTTYTLDQLPIRATGDMTISLRLNDLYKVVATAENATVSIAVNDGEATELPAEGINVANGSKVVLTFVPAADMVFKSFTVNGEDAELTDNTYTIDAINADYTFAAVYKAFTYKLIVINPTDADVPENNVYGEFVDNMMEPLEYDEAEGIEVAPGDRAFLNILPAENHGTADSYYMFEALTDNGVEVSGTELLPSGNGYVYPIFNINSDHVLVITQSLYNGIVGVVADAEGMISFSDYTIRVAADNAQIDIFDLNGRTLRSVAANEITVSDLVKGVYFAKATVNGKVYTLKFIKL